MWGAGFRDGDQDPNKIKLNYQNIGTQSVSRALLSERDMVSEVLCS